ncbi:MAG: hypothetical protein WCA14_13690, partial [Steroidobacteraceae bacterium]
LTAQADAPSQSRPAAAHPAVAAEQMREAISFVVPPANAAPAPLLVPSTELANYVVAHSMFSSPVTRRNLLSAFMTGEAAGAAIAAPTLPVSDAQSHAQ